MSETVNATLRRLAQRATQALDPTTSAIVVIAFVAWAVARPFLHLGSGLGSAVDAFTTVTVLIAAILIDASRETSAGSGMGDPRSSGRPPVP